MSRILSTVGKNVRELRRSLGWTQERLAEKSDISVPFMTQIELGKKQPSLDVVEKIADSLGVPVARLFAESNIENATINYEVFCLERRVIDAISHVVSGEFDNFLKKKRRSAPSVEATN